MEQQLLQELFGFHFTHKNLGDLTGVFQIEPMEDGLKTLTSYDLSFKLKKDGFSVVAPVIQPENTGLFQLKKQFIGQGKLAFVVFCNDPHFEEAANLPSSPPGQFVYYLNNLDENQRRTRLLLASNLGLKESERVCLHSKQFSGALVQNQQKQWLRPRVLDCRNQVIPETDYDLAVDEIQNMYWLDLSRLADGLYTISYNDVSTVYYCCKASLIRRIPLLILELFYDTDVPEKYRLIKIQDQLQYNNSVQFGLHLGNYSYYWRYQIIPQNIPPSTWFQLLISQKGYGFVPEKSTVEPDQAGMLFTSISEMETPNPDLKVDLYELIWNSDCYWKGPAKYQYCNQMYGIPLKQGLWCRYPDKNQCKYQCPARNTQQFLSHLPKPDEVTTQYVTENGKQYAQITLYLIKEHDQYRVSLNKAALFQRPPMPSAGSGPIHGGENSAVDWVKSPPPDTFVNHRKLLLNGKKLGRPETVNPEARPTDDFTPEQLPEGITPLHLQIIAWAQKTPFDPGVKEWTTADIVEWKAAEDDQILFAFKGQWIKGYKNSILRAAQQYDLPAYLIAGVAYVEVGGDPLWLDDLLYNVRKVLPTGRRAVLTHFGNISIAVKTAAETLGYGGRLKTPHKEAVINSLKDPRQNILIAAKYLSDLRDIDYRGIGTGRLTSEQVIIIGSRFNKDKKLSLQEITKDRSYGEFIVKRQKILEDLLQN